MYVCMYVCMYVFIKLHITTQSGPVCMYVRMYVFMYVFLCPLTTSCKLYIYVSVVSQKQLET